MFSRKLDKKQIKKSLRKNKPFKNNKIKKQEKIYGLKTFIGIYPQKAI